MNAKVVEVLLSDYVESASGEQRELARRCSAFIGASPELFSSRELFTPGHCTASAFVVNPERTHTLLIEHASVGLWIQPGGHIEPGDVSLQAAALREVKEETGLDGVIVQEGIFDVDIHTIRARPERNAPEHLHFDIRFLVTVPFEKCQVHDDGVTAIQWVPLYDIREPRFEAALVRMAALCITH